jgi:hypothetical protein
MIIYLHLTFVLVSLQTPFLTAPLLGHELKIKVTTKVELKIFTSQKN